MGRRRRTQMTLVDAFQQAQKNVVHHEACVAASLQIFEEHYTDDPETGLDDFLRSFLDLFNRSLIVFKREPAVERIIEFAVKFVAATTAASCFDQDARDDADSDEEDDETADAFVFMNAFIQHLVSISDAKDKAVRFRACQTLSKLLHALAEDAEIDDDIWDALQAAMLKRIRDKIPVVRVQAINALSRLQDPSDLDCPVITEYRQRLISDGSPDVRKTALIQIALNKATIVDAISRSRDVKDVVRKALYTVLMEKLDLRALSIQSRLDLVRDGLNDRCDDVREACGKLIVNGWFEQLERIPSALFDVLDVETDEATCERVADTLLSRVENWSSWKAPTVETITPSSAFWWRQLCVCKHKQQDHDALDEVLPLASDLAEMLDRVAAAIVKTKLRLDSGDIDDEDDDDDGEELLNEEDAEVQLQTTTFVFCQLLKLAKIVDYSDEAGRRAMSSRIRSLVINHWSQLHETVRESCLELLSALHPSRSDRLQQMAEIIQELKFDGAPEAEEEQDEGDGESSVGDAHESAVRTLAKLHILSFALKQLRTSPQNTCLEYFLQDLVLPCIQNRDAELRNAAIRCLGLFCIADMTLAQSHLLLLLQVAQVDQEALQLTALKILFDLVLAFGVPALMGGDTASQQQTKMGEVQCDSNDELLDEEEQGELAGPPSTTAASNKTSIIPVLKRYLDSDDDNLRCTAVEGFAKLLLHNHICSAQVFSHLTILYFNPITTEDVTLRQCLSVFFPAYGFSSRAHQDVIEEAFLPTIRTFALAPRSSPLYSVKLQDAVDLFVYLTGAVNAEETGIPAAAAASLGAHDSVALAMANEVLSDPIGAAVKPLCKALSMLDLAAMDDTTRQALFVLGESMLKDVEDRYARGYIQKMTTALEMNGTDISPEAREALAAKQSKHQATRAEDLGATAVTDAGPKRERKTRRAKSKATATLRSKAQAKEESSDSEDDSDGDDSDPNDDGDTPEVDKEDVVASPQKPAGCSTKQQRPTRVSKPGVAQSEESEAEDTAASDDIEDLLSDEDSQDDSDEEGEFEIEALLKVKRKGRKRFFRVRWKDAGASEDTWEPEENLPAEMVAEFEASQDKENTRKPQRRKASKQAGTKRVWKSKETSGSKRAQEAEPVAAEIDVLLMSDDE